MSFLGVFILVCIFSYGVEGKMTFKTTNGDVYDCVDFYKQPAFDLPMLKNHNFHHLMRPTFFDKSTKRKPIAEETIMERKRCPIGFVPIRKFIKSSPKRESFIFTNEASGTYLAGVRTKSGSTRYGGGGMQLSLWNPPFVKPLAYTQARMRVSSGPDAIQVGWRVDPFLRGDNLTRQYIYTETGQSHCFDAQCGFVIVNRQYPLDQVLQPISILGGPIYLDAFNITRDKPTGHWWLLYERNFMEIGFWPKEIFTGLANLASNVDWAGEVYSPPGVEEPVMGSGYKPETGDSRYVAYFKYITVVTKDYTSIDADDLEEFATDRSKYDVKDEGEDRPNFNRIVFYGGARY